MRRTMVDLEKENEALRKENLILRRKVQELQQQVPTAEEREIAFQTAYRCSVLETAMRETAENMTELKTVYADLVAARDREKERPKE
jgi:hypothetical protein